MMRPVILLLTALFIPTTATIYSHNLYPEFSDITIKPGMTLQYVKDNLPKGWKLDLSLPEDEHAFTFIHPIAPDGRMDIENSIQVLRDGRILAVWRRPSEFLKEEIREKSTATAEYLHAVISYMNERGAVNFTIEATPRKVTRPFPENPDITHVEAPKIKVTFAEKDVTIYVTITIFDGTENLNPAPSGTDGKQFEQPRVDLTVCYMFPAIINSR